MSETVSSPAERRKLKVRSAIIDAAEKVFEHEGEAGLSIRRIAEEIDYSPAAIYKYFTSKDELVEELKESFFGRLLTRIEAYRKLDGDFPRRLRVAFVTYIETALEQPHHYALAFSGLTEPESAPAHDFGDEAFLDSNKGRAFAFLVSVMQEGLDSGQFRYRETAEIIAKSVWASLHGLALMMGHLPRFPDLSVTADTSDRARFIRLHADLIARGLEAQHELVEEFGHGG